MQPDGYEIDKWPPAARSADPRISREAEAKFTESGGRKTQAGRILEAIRTCPGMTADELAMKIDLNTYKVRKRTSDLKNLGVVYQRGTRTGNDGFRQGCWWPVAGAQLEMDVRTP